MKITTAKVKHYGTRTKTIILIDGTPFLITDSLSRASKVISKINGNQNIELHDKSVERMIERLVQECQSINMTEARQGLTLSLLQ